MAANTDYSAREAARSEKALIGALLLDAATAWPLVKDIINATHLARHDHRLIFAAVAGLMEDTGAADIALVLDRLGPKLDEAGGAEYLSTLIEETPSAVNAAAYARTVKKYAGRGKVVDLAQEIQARARTGAPEDAAQYAADELRRIASEMADRVEPLRLEPASAWAHRQPPAGRDWVLEHFIPAGRVTSLFGNGGLGKTLVALQIALHVSTGRPLFGLDVAGGPVLGVFCEDEEDELNRRVRAACHGERLDLADADRLYAVSRDGMDSVLCTFERDHIRLTQFYHQLDATIADLKPRLVILDTAADLFAGDFMSTPHVRQFLKIALGGLCTRHGCAVLLLAHPSASAMASGDGGGFSTAWNNSVRSRLYLSRPKAPEGVDEAIVHDKRVLEVKKSNYAADGTQIPLSYTDGYFVRDDDPVQTMPASTRVRTTRLSLRVVELLRDHDTVLSFRAIFDTLQTAGDIPPGDYDVRRKPLQRALKSLVAEGVIRETTMPRGYKFLPESGT